MSQISTHVLDTTLGEPARGVNVTLVRADGATLGTATTDEAGRVGGVGADSLDPGAYRLVFDVGSYFGRMNRDTFFPVVSIDFFIADNSQRYHIPLLISPFAYSTYRGSH